MACAQFGKGVGKQTFSYILGRGRKLVLSNKMKMRTAFDLSFPHLGI